MLYVINQDSKVNKIRRRPHIKIHNKELYRIKKKYPMSPKTNRMRLSTVLVLHVLSAGL